jgi:hypothetical protein
MHFRIAAGDWNAFIDSQQIDKADSEPKSASKTIKPTAEATIAAAGVDVKEAKRLAGILKKAGLL